MNIMDKKIALFPGTFDPFTLGHHDIVIRGLKIFDEICIAIGNNPKKKRYFEVDNMINKISGLYSNNDRISVISYNKLTAEIAKEKNARYILRGLRNTTDFELHASEETKLVIKILELAGIVIKDPNLYQLVEI